VKRPEDNLVRLVLFKAAHRAAAWRRDASANPLFAKGIAGAAVVAFADQAAKIWIVDILRLPERARGKIEISGLFDLTYVQNTGASFGMLAGGLGSRIFLSVVSLAIAGVMVAWLGRVTRPLAAAGIAFIIGGAVGNLFDRVAYGYVVDFLDFSGAYFPWVFNIADASINVGLALLILDAWRTRNDPQ